MDGKRRNTETNRRIGIDQLVIDRIIGIKEIFQVQFLAGVDGTGDFLVKHFKKVFHPEPVIDKQVFFIFFIQVISSPFIVVDDIFNDKDKGLTFGPGETENCRVEFIQVKIDIQHQFHDIIGEKGFSLRQHQVSFFVQVFPFDQGIDDNDQVVNQLFAVLLVQFHLGLLQLGEKRCQ
jgi:hypothetical protein